MITTLLKPDDREIQALARKEASVELEPSFSPNAYGFVGNIIILMLIGLAAVVWVPARIFWRTLGLLKRRIF